MIEEQGDPMAALMTALGRRNGPWVYHENAETGAIAIFPKTATDVEAWEARALEMIAEQKPMTLAPKPTQNELAARKILSRGD